MPGLKSADILKISGAFEKDPQRERSDLAGAGEFHLEPPPHLPGNVIPCWRYIVERLPKAGLSKSEEVAVELAARLYAQCRDTPTIAREYKGLNDSLVALLIQLGMTRLGRAKLGTGGKDKTPSKFAKLQKDAKSASA